MNKINTIITIVAATFLYACASHKTQYRNSDDSDSITNIPTIEIDKSFYLIGNAGSSGNTASNAVQSLKNHLDEQNTDDSFVLFLGNSFYPSGMPPKDETALKNAEQSMQLQLDALSGFQGNIIVLPGNRDWKGGVDGLELEEDF